MNYYRNTIRYESQPVGQYQNSENIEDRASSGVDGTDTDWLLHIVKVITDRIRPIKIRNSLLFIILNTQMLLFYSGRQK